MTASSPTPPTATAPMARPPRTTAPPTPRRTARQPPSDAAPRRRRRSPAPPSSARCAGRSSARRWRSATTRRAAATAIATAEPHLPRRPLRRRMVQRHGHLGMGAGGGQHPDLRLLGRSVVLGRLGGGRDGISGGHATILGPHGKAQPGDMVFFGSAGQQPARRDRAQALRVGRDPRHERQRLLGRRAVRHRPGVDVLPEHPRQRRRYGRPGLRLRRARAATATWPPPRPPTRRCAPGSRPTCPSPRPPNPVKGQDPRGPQRQHQLQEAKHPAAQQMPYVGKRITVEVTNVTRSGSTTSRSSTAGQRPPPSVTSRRSSSATTTRAGRTRPLRQAR